MTIKQIIARLTLLQTSLAVTRSDGTTIIDDGIVKYCMLLQGSWEYLYSDAGQPEAAYQTDWVLYNNLYKDDLDRALAALYSSYDPISNYDMIEEGADGERRAKMTDTTTPHGKITTDVTLSGTLQTDTTLYKSGVDSSGDGVQTDKSTTVETPTTRKTTTETSYQTGTDSVITHQSDNDKSATAAGTTLTGLDTGREHVLSRKGNIGVTTSQQMISSELELRKQDFILQYIRRFIAYHCSSIGEAETW